jgi:hypothetical protein
MNNKLLVFCFFLCFSNYLYSQTITFDQIKKSGEYIYGIGESPSYEKADKNALSDLVSQISVTVESSFEYIQTESNFDYKEYAKSVVKTYSGTSLNNVQRIEYEENGIYTVIRFILKADINKVFEDRKKAILEYTKEGIRSEWKYQIGDALRNFYWANILLRSHPEYNSMYFHQNNDSVLFKIYLPNKINEIFSNINLRIIENTYNPEEQYSKYTLGLEYKDGEIQNLDYTYRSGNSWSGTIGANNGLAFVEYYGDKQKKDREITIRVEYRYEDKGYFDKDVQSVFASEIDLPYFSQCEIKSQFNKPISTKTRGLTFENSGNENIKSTIKTLVQSIEKKKLNPDPNLFTQEGIEAYNKLIKYGDAKLLKQNNELKIVKVNNEFIVRSIPMQFTFTENRQFVENVVFVTKEDGKIHDINFSLSQVAINDILSKDERFANEEEKFFLIRFMENYKTAYCLKRIDYLEKVFDDDALIIVGNVIKRNTKSDIFYSSLSDSAIQYQRYTKSEYINRLKSVFAHNEFVNIHFEDNVVKKAKKDVNIYGIQIAQHYTSERYADKGYLFLLFDLRDTLNPIIHVRTWQPKKNKDGSIYGLADFHFDTF